MLHLLLSHLNIHIVRILKLVKERMSSSREFGFFGFAIWIVLLSLKLLGNINDDLIIEVVKAIKSASSGFLGLTCERPVIGSWQTYTVVTAVFLSPIELLMLNPYVRLLLSLLGLQIYQLQVLGQPDGSNFVTWVPVKFSEPSTLYLPHGTWWTKESPKSVDKEEFESKEESSHISDVPRLIIAYLFFIMFLFYPSCATYQHFGKIIHAIARDFVVGIKRFAITASYPLLFAMKLLVFIFCWCVLQLRSISAPLYTYYQLVLSLIKNLFVFLGKHKKTGLYSMNTLATHAGVGPTSGSPGVYSSPLSTHFSHQVGSFYIGSLSFNIRSSFVPSLTPLGCFCFKQLVRGMASDASKAYWREIFEKDDGQETSNVHILARRQFNSDKPVTAKIINTVLKFTETSDAITEEHLRMFERISPVDLGRCPLSLPPP
jgi:hypothetical protein